MPGNQNDAPNVSPSKPAPGWQAWLPSRGNVVFVLVVAVALLFYVHTVGAVPDAAPAVASINVIPYQGRLADSGGNPLNGSFAMTFKLYNLASGGGALWTEAHSSGNDVVVSNGLFNVMLGSLTPIPQTVFTANNALWLGITVGSDAEMMPRVQLGSAPFAVQALTVPDRSISASKLASGTVVNRYTVEWFGSETAPCTTSSTTYVDCGLLLGNGVQNQFPAPLAGANRQYRLMVAWSNNLGASDTSYVQIERTDDNSSVMELNLGAAFADASYEVWKTSPPFNTSAAVHMRLQIRLSVSGHMMWLYRAWLVAEDVMP